VTRRRPRSLAPRATGLPLLLGLLLVAGPACQARAEDRLEPTGPAASAGIWVSRDEIRELPTGGAAWDALVRTAREPVRTPDLSDQDDPDNVRVMAKALVAVRTGDEALAAEVVDACRRVRGSERSASALAVGRKITAYVIAADLVGLPAAERKAFETWLRGLRERRFKGRTIRSTHEDRPNNWGTHAGAARIAIAAYLGDRDEVERAAWVFAGWTGEAEGWRRFEFGKPWWQADPARPVAVNPVGALRDGHPIGGVLPDDQRRGGRFRWPPPRENYVWEALQGATAQAVMLERAGYAPWGWGDRALYRAVEWLHREADYPAQGDDTWIPHVVNRAYGSHFPAPTPSRPGKAVGFTDWTHAGGDAAASGDGPSAAPEPSPRR
jgi:hypothetical protein